MAHRILNLPHTKPISGCSLCSVTFSENDVPTIDATLKPNIGLQNLHKCPNRTPERRSKHHHSYIVLAANTPTLCHKAHASSKSLQRMPLTSDFVNSDPSEPLPIDLARLGNCSEILVITTGTFRQKLPRNLINAYASFYRPNAQTRSWLTKSNYQRPSIPPLPWNATRRSPRPSSLGIVHHAPPTPSPWNLHIHNGFNPDQKPSFTVVSGALYVQLFAFLAHLLGAAKSGHEPLIAIEDSDDLETPH
jgi:hypothetical protein